MRFGAIQWLWALLLVPVVAALLWYAHRLRRLLAARFAESAAWAALNAQIWKPARRWRSLLLLLGLSLVIFAVARPQWGARAVMLKRRGLDIVVALDVSKSMLATDVKPDRLTRAKREISGVLDRLAGDRVGLIVFAGDAFVQCPLTLDGAAARLLLEAVDTRSAGRPGTAIAEAIKTAKDMFETNEHQFKVLILVTDGESTEGDALSAAQDAATAGIRIYTVGVGTPSGEPIPVYDDEGGQQLGFKKDDAGQVVLSKLDEVELQKIALATEGRYFRAGPTEMEIDALFDELSKLEKKEMEGRLFTEFEERFQYLLVPAFLLLLAEFVLPEVRPPENWLAQDAAAPETVIVIVLTKPMRSSRANSFSASTVLLRVIFCAALVVCSVAVSRADEFARRNNEGNRLVKKGQLDRALQRYQEAKVERPDRPEVDYNIGNVYHLEGKLDSAAKQYQNALSTLTGPVAPDASYNLGNTYYRLQKYGPAIEAYKQALIDNPKDPDAKHNLELALRRLQADSTKQQQKQQNQEDQQNKSDSTQQKQDQKKNDQQNQQKKDSTQQNQQSQKNKPDSTQGQPPPSGQDKPEQGDQKKQQQSRQQVGMTKEDAKRILDALKNDELKVQRLRAQHTAQETAVKKDW